MRKFLKPILLSGLIFLLALLAVSCSGELSPYRGYNEQGYTVSVRYDANGGVFTTNTEIIVDTYDLSKYTADANGKKALKLFAPDDQARGTQAYTAERVDYYLAGWYTERTEQPDGSYTYGGWWDFSTEKLMLDASGSYSAEEPVLTLYAAWVPAFRYEFYLLGENGGTELIGSSTLDPTKDTAIRLPALNPTTGRIGDPNDFPNLTNKTYDKIYSDAGKASEITGATLTHSGVFDREHATLSDPVMQIYCTARDGLWFEVDSAEKITKNSYLNAHYILKNDIDFAGKAWPATFLSRNFTGSVEGNGYSIKNVTVTQSDNTCVNFGLFGQLTADASLSNVTFDGITVQINAGSRMQNPNFGILAGTVAEGADITDVVLKNSRLVITRKPNLNISTTPTFGLVSGYGSLTGITYSENNTLAFAEDGTMTYEYELDAEGRCTLTKVS